MLSNFKRKIILEFSTIKKIELRNRSSWNKKIFITFDLDWCSDQILLDLLKLIQNSDIEATFFVTHNTPILDKLRRNKNYELGIHPNFNFLVEGDHRYGKTYEEVVDFYLNIVPEAISVRSHSLFDNSRLSKIFYDKGLKHVSNFLIPSSSNIRLKPWKSIFDLSVIPFHWEDDVHCLSNLDWGIDNFIHKSGLNVFNFHPTHIFLNTYSINEFQKARNDLYKHDKLGKWRNTKYYGTRDFLKDLIKIKNIQD